MEVPYYVVNSFSVIDPRTRQRIGGNGAAVVFMESASQFDDSLQIEIAKRFPQLTEAVFVHPCPPSDPADFGMRYWSPQRHCEYSITGHPTIAAMHAMLSHGHKSIVPGKTDYVLKTKAGNVSLSVGKDGLVFMGQIEPRFQDIPSDMQPEIYDMFGLEKSDVTSPIKGVNLGLGYFIFRVKNVETLMRMKRDLPKLRKANERFGLNGGAQPYTDLSSSPYDLRTRNLDLRPANTDGLWLEDSACGQGSASLMAYLMKYMGHPGTLVSMEQGVPFEPCCVTAHGKINGEKMMVFIGGVSVEKERGMLLIQDHTIKFVQTLNHPAP